LRIKDKLNDGEIVLVRLKNRKVEQSEEEKEWYDRAFGPKQNMMNIKFVYNPPNENIFKKGKVDLYMSLKYKMFDEMEKEFKKEDFPHNARYLIAG